MNIYLTQPEFNESIVRDNIWQWTPIELAIPQYGSLLHTYTKNSWEGGKTIKNQRGMNKHYCFSDIKYSVLSDGKWTWKAVDLPSKGVGKFQIEEGYAYVVQFKPKSGLSGLLFGSERQTRIVKSMNRKWGRLYTIFQEIGNNISIVLVKYKRNDCSELEYYYWSNNSIYTAQYKLTIESEVVDPESAGED